MKTLQVVTLAIGLFISWSAHAQDSTTARGLIEEMARTYEGNCKAQGSNNIFFCVCAPAKLRALLTSLPHETLAKQITTEQEFIGLIKPAVLDKCAGEKLRAQYGEACATNAEKMLGKNAPKYCDCMKRAAGTFTDAEAAGLGLESAEYIPRAAEVQKRGEPLPEQPPLLKRMLSLDKACGGGMSRAFEEKPAKGQ